MTHPADRALPSWLVEVPFAHRGWHGDGVPENSLPAVAAAIEHGVGVEVDVRPTADGTAIVIHDDDLERTTGVAGLVAETPTAALTDLSLEGTDAGVPTLAAVLDLVAGRVPVMVEIKNPNPRTGPVEPAVAGALRGYAGPACVASFNPLTVAWFRRHAPRILRGQTAAPLSDVPMPAVIRASLRRLWWNAVTRPHFVSYALWGLPTGPTRRWRRRGRPLVAWTVDSAGAARSARRVADNVILEGHEALAAWTGEVVPPG